MLDPNGLYDLADGLDGVPEGLPLVAGLTGFTDAGSVVGQLTEHLLEHLEHREVLVFDNDALLDYRARRPMFTFDGDQLTDYEPARLALDLVTDELDRPFLLLTGFEPDFQWERFAAAIVGIVDRYRVATTTWVHAIPMPVPHTRPIGLTVSGNRREIADALSVWRPRSQVPGNALQLVEYRLQELQHPTAGLVLLVPHYLAETEHPGAALAALESVSAATGLVFPTDLLRDEDREYLAKVDDQVESNGELARLVGTLEERHDDYMQNASPLRSPLTDQDGALPSADEIAAELERFLATRRDDDGAPPAA